MIYPDSRVDPGFSLGEGVGGAGASEAFVKKKHWRGKRLFVNNGLPLQCFVCSEPSDASEGEEAKSLIYGRGPGPSV